ncbi:MULTISPECIES: hypothetical protein [Chelatococcus]|uniref:Uncharacterized protein n=1 Tax=Chelatococcus caeni TaxID=1348468 RepID=A0A840BW44_9HYPH|nr:MULTISPECIES: hypothetical protein [Chelatococcus]ALA16074.1 hypothetical protein AL346_00040 [Chelatococcus sp. CO-6]ALA19360.1 hypothetical protein AL346_20500 [Chelatococcus sp. CO-6]MBB4017575.1 hypothetical protein [Chelatococcus caeni]
MIEIEAPDGSIVEFPDGTPDDVITDAMRRAFGGPQQSGTPVAQAPAAAPQPAPGAQPAPPISLGDSQVNWQDQVPPPAAAQAPIEPPGAAKSLLFGTQAVGRGLADAAGALPDLSNFAANILLGGADLAARPFGGSVDFRFGPSPIGSNAIADRASQLVESAGIDLVDPQEMPAGQRVLYDAARGGTAAAATAAPLARAAPTLVAAREGGQRIAPPAAERLIEPYVSSPARTIVGDIAGGAGAQTAAGQVERSETVQDAPPWLKGIVQILAPFVGAVGGVGLTEGVGGLGSAARTAALRRSTDTNLAPDPFTGQSFNRADVEQVAREVQDASRQGLPMRQAGAAPERAAQTIEDRANEFRAAGLPVPTTGLIADNVGLAGLEGQQRVTNRAPFINRDDTVSGAASERVRSIRDETADPQAAREYAQRYGETRLDQAQREVDRERGRLREVETAQAADRGAQVPLASRAARDEASGRLHQSVVEDYTAARAEKNRQFDEAPGRVEQLPADSVTAAAQRVRERVNALNPRQREELPGDFVERLEALAPDIRQRTVTSPVLDESGRPITRVEEVNVGGPGTAAGGDLAELRKTLSTAEEVARTRGNFKLADGIRDLRGAINRTIEEAPGYAEANQTYREFAGRYRPTPTDEMAKFTREIDRGREPPPSQTASRFLGSGPEKVASLRRVISERGEGAATDYLLGEVANIALSGSNRLNWQAVSNWASRNASVLREFPAAQREVNSIIARARRGDQLSTEQLDRLRQAERQLGATQRDLDRSAAGILMDKDPQRAARAILNDSDDPVGRMREAVKLLGRNEKALRGFRAAVADEMLERVTTTKPDALKPDEFATTYAQLTRNFEKNRAALAEVLTPEQMNALQQAHSLLKSFTTMGKQALPGSQTGERFGNFLRPLEMAVRIRYGALQGGSIMKKARLLLSNIPTNEESVNALKLMMATDPDVAVYLLRKDVRNFDAPAANGRLQRLLATASAARATNEED